MYDHGFYDSNNKKWFCTYFMNLDEWLDIHDYMPSIHETNSSLPANLDSNLIT